MTRIGLVILFVVLQVAFTPMARATTVDMGDHGCVAARNLAAVRATHLDELNGLRQRQALNTLTANDILDEVAQNYACVLAATGHFDHVGPDGSTLAQRVKMGGYDFCVVSENLAKGQRTVQQAMVGWVKSPGHWRNLKRKDVTETGFGVAAAAGAPAPRRAAGTLSELAAGWNGTVTMPDGGSAQYVWVQLFAAPCF